MMSLLSSISRIALGGGSGMDTCENCGCSISRGVLTLPWEDGDNSYAYVTCPNCGCENVQYGYGEDDD